MSKNRKRAKLGDKGFEMTAESPRHSHIVAKTRERSHLAQELYEYPGGQYQVHVPELTRCLTMRALRIMSTTPHDRLEVTS